MNDDEKPTTAEGVEPSDVTSTPAPEQAQEPAAQEPVAQDLAAQEPAAQEPALQEPAAQEPALTPEPETVPAATAVIPEPVYPAATPPEGASTDVAGDVPSEPTPPAATPPAATPPGGFSALVAPARLAAPVAHAAIVYGVTWGVALIVTALALVAFANSSPDWSLVFFGPFQLVGAAFGGTIVASASVASFGTAALGVFWLPQLLTAVGIVAGVYLTRRDERLTPTPSAAGRWILSGASGLTLAIIATVLSAVLPAHLDYKDTTGMGLSTVVTGTSASVTLFLGALVFGTLVAFLARSSVVRSREGARPTPQLLAFWLRSLSPVALYLVVGSVLLGIGVLIVATINGGLSLLLTSPLWLPTVVTNLFALMNLSVLSVAGGGLTSAAGLDTFGNSSWMPTSFPVWATVIIVVINILLILLAGTHLAARRAGAPAPRPLTWLVTAASFALAGIVISVLGSILFWTSTSGAGFEGLGALGGSAMAAFNTTGAVGPAPWTFLVFGILGLAVEAVARFVAPTVRSILPARADARLMRWSRRGVVAEPVAEGVVATPLEPAPLTPARKRLVILVSVLVAAVLLFIVLASVAVTVINSVAFGPQQKVEAYLAELKDHDAEGALALAPDSSDGATDLLTNEVYNATEDGVTGYSITDSTIGGGSAIFTVDVTQGGTVSEATYTVTKRGTTALFFDNWILDPVYLPSVTVSVGSGIDAIAINGVEIDAETIAAGEGYISLPALPGSYVVTTGGDDEWFTAEPQTVTVTADPAGVEPVSLEVTPSDALVATVTDQVTAYLDECATSTDTSPTGCPFYAFAYNASDISWKIDSVPPLAIESDYAGGWRVSSSEVGTATMSYTSESFFSDETTDEEYETTYYLSGTLDFSSGAPVFSAN